MLKFYVINYHLKSSQNAHCYHLEILLMGWAQTPSSGDEGEGRHHFSLHLQHGLTTVSSEVPEVEVWAADTRPHPMVLWRYVFTRASVPESQSGGSLPQKTSIDSPHAPSLVTIGYFKASALVEIVSGFF